jgi:hypothetical protein
MEDWKYGRLEDWENLSGYFLQPSNLPFCFVCVNKLTVLKFSLPTIQRQTQGDARFGRFPSFNLIIVAAAGGFDSDRATANSGSTARTPADWADYAGCLTQFDQTLWRFGAGLAAVDCSLGRAGLAGAGCLDPAADRSSAARSCSDDALPSTAFTYFLFRAAPAYRNPNGSSDSWGCLNPKTDCAIY